MNTEIKTKTKRLLKTIEVHTAKFEIGKAELAIELYEDKYKGDNFRVVLEYDYQDTLKSFVGDMSYIPHLDAFVQDHELNQNFRNFVFLDVNAINAFVDKLDIATDNNIPLCDVDL